VPRLRPDARWGIILAGGEGTRLRTLTRRITGDDRPKQFCPILGGETLLERTRRRVALTIPPDQTLMVVTRHHEPFYAELRAEVGSRGLVVQPAGRGTAAAMLYGLLRVAEAVPQGTVAVLPSDHYVSDDARFMAHVEAAREAVEARPDLVVLLGVEAAAASVEYGWIELGAAILDHARYPVHRVRRFWEKPPAALAEALLARGCVWNTFVVVARVSALLATIRQALPDLDGAFADAWSQRAARGEAEAMRSLYARLVSRDFSRDVLGGRPANLAVLPVTGLAWSDWGAPDRVHGTLARLGIDPPWAEVAAADHG
jgi:mannose-1-phosphate guanylyltransferase